MVIKREKELPKRNEVKKEDTWALEDMYENLVT